MKIGIFTALFNDRPLEEVIAYVARLGYEMVELPAWQGNNHFDISQSSTGDLVKIKKMITDSGLAISAINNSLAGQLVLGPLDHTTDEWAPSPEPAEKIKFGMEQMVKTAQVAADLGVSTVTGFVGSHVWDKWYIFPPKNEAAYEQGWELFAERWNKIMDAFDKYGVRFALEVHPTEIAYNTETTAKALEIMAGHKSFGLNFDPSHLIWQLIDPVVFIKKFGERIYHVHAKDAELQMDEVPKYGVIPTGSWIRSDRSFRFRVPGWGDVNWRKIITALLSVGYDYCISFEHEDPVMSPDDGAEKAIEYLRPLIIKKPLEKVWW